MTLQTKRFQKRVENFICEKCGTHVTGTGYTDHCPKCLTGKHVDNNPGDRNADCGGTMKPISTHYKSGEIIISYECQKCGTGKNVKAAENDDREKLFGLLASPPRKRGRY
jgi:hypothetical protein